MLIDPPGPRALRVLRKAAAIAGLRLRNRVSRRPVVGTDPIAVSLTSYGNRLHIVHHAVESIARSRVRPLRFVLWVSDEGFEIADHPPLVRLAGRGLEVRQVEDLGPYKKNFAYARELSGDGLPLITADDDIIYPAGWLDGLVDAHREHPDDLVGYRGHRISLDDDGEVAPYLSWEPAQPGDTGPGILVTGGSGAVLPLALVSALRDAGTAFLETCPRADDVWFNVMAMRAGVPQRIIPAGGRSMLSYPRSQDGALHHENAGGGGNDRQIAATLTGSDLTRIVTAVRGDG